MGTRITRPSDSSAPGFEGDAIARDGMFHGAKWLKSNRSKAKNFCCVNNSPIRLLNRSSRRQSALTFLAEIMSGLIPLCGTATLVCDFHVREFPEMRVDDAGGPLA